MGGRRPLSDSLLGLGFGVGAMGVWFWFWALTFIVVALILTLDAADWRIVFHITLVP
jgi:hypothetical protein